MKKLIITTALFAFASVPVFAQSTQTQAAPMPAKQQPVQQQQMTAAQRSEKMAEHQSKTYAQQYKLNEEQTKKIHDACLEFATTIENSRASGKQITRADVDAALAARNAQFKSVMTAEQYKAYDATLAHSAPQPAPNGPVKVQGAPATKTK